MGFTNFIRNVWAASIEMALQKVLVYQSVANTNYEGQLQNLNDEVTILQIGKPTAKAYTKDADIAAPEKINDAAAKLKADQAYYFNFAVNDVEAVQKKQELLAACTQEAGYAFADAVDQYMAGLYAQAGLTLYSNDTPADVTSLNVDDILLEAAEKMSENDIPKQNRFIIIPDWFCTKMILAGLAVKTQNDALYDNSVIARRHNFDIIVSNNVSKNSTSWDKSRIIAGVRGKSFTFAGVISSVEAYRPEKRFEDAVKGLYIFGGKCVRPDQTLVLYADKTAEV